MEAKQKGEAFQIACGNCFLGLERYKLKTNLLGCNLDYDQFTSFYQQFDKKPALRMALAKQKIQQMVNCFEKNSIFLHALELKTINNMLRDYRSRMDLLTNEPTDYNYAKFEKEESELIETVITNQMEKIGQVEDLLSKIGRAEQSCSQTLEEKLKKRGEVIPKIENAFKIISRAEIRYCRYYETFQRSMSNMVNELHSHIDKLNQFYTVWENLGSSMMFTLRSDREVRIDKTIEQRRNRSSHIYIEDKVDLIKQVIEVMPVTSRLRQSYIQRLEELEKEHEETEQKLTQARSRFNKTKEKPSNLRYNLFTPNKANWYENVEKDRKIMPPNSEILLAEKEEGFFKYTYEQVHAQTVQYLSELKRNAPRHSYQVGADTTFGDRFYVYSDKKIQEKANNTSKPRHYNVPPHMNFRCWNDRLGAKGYFNIQDFPMNIVQRRIQFENDRQVQMQTLDEKRKRDYNLKENQMDRIGEERPVNMGYRFLDKAAEFQYHNRALFSSFDPEYLPKPRKPKKENLTFSDEEEADKNQMQVKEPQSPTKSSKADSIRPKQPQPLQKDQSNPKPQEQVPKTTTEKSINPSRTIVAQPSQQNSSELNMLEDRPSAVWFKMKDNFEDESLLQKLTVNYLPEYILSLQSQNYEDDEEEIGVEFAYLENTDFQTIRKNLKKTSLQKLYLINSKFFVRAQKIQFRDNKSEIKCEIFWGGEVDQSSKLKENLTLHLESIGLCKFKMVKLNKSDVSAENLEYWIVGMVADKEKGKETECSYEQAIKEGERIMKDYKKYLQEIAKAKSCE